MKTQVRFTVAGEIKSPQKCVFKWNGLKLLVRLSACINAAPIGWISMIFDIGDFYKNRRETPYLVKAGQEYQAVSKKT
jgi:hypothetical protein